MRESETEKLLGKGGSGLYNDKENQGEDWNEGRKGVETRTRRRRVREG